MPFDGKRMLAVKTLMSKRCPKVVQWRRSLFADKVESLTPDRLLQLGYPHEWATFGKKKRSDCRKRVLSILEKYEGMGFLKIERNGRDVRVLQRHYRDPLYGVSAQGKLFLN